MIFIYFKAHQVYGETENIFGYQDLEINVLFSAGTLDIYYDVKYGKRVDDLTNNQGLKADNVDVITEIFPDGVSIHLTD